MEEVSSGVTDQSAVIIIDQNKLRRASVVNFLHAWADSIAASLIGMCLFVTPQDLETRFKCRLVVLNLGGNSIDSPDAQCLLEILYRQLPDTPVVLFSDLEEPREVVAAFRAGTKGFIPASIEPDIVVQALTFIMGGGTFFPPEVLLELRQEPDPDNGTGNGNRGAANDRDVSLNDGASAAGGDLQGGRSGQLTLRQLDVLALLRQGKPNKLIARELGMCEATVKVHVRQIMRKLGASNRTQAALCVMEISSDIPPHAGPIKGVLPPEVGSGDTKGNNVSKLSKGIEEGCQFLAGGLLAIPLVEWAIFDMAAAMPVFLM